MGGGAAKQANNIAQASLNESKRQYEEQEREKEAKKARDKSNAQANRTGTVFAYGNNAALANDFTSGKPAQEYSLLSIGTAPVMNDLMGGFGGGANNTLGG